MRASLVTCLCLAACHRGPLDYPRADEIGVAKTELELAKHELTPAEHEVFDKNGFAILEGGAANSFHVGYTALFHAHQPVYVTADSLLHAWHSSFDHILIDVERSDLIPRVTAMLTTLRERLAATPADAAGRADVDLYLAAALSMLGKPVAPVAGADPAAIAELYGHAVSATGTDATLFGSPMQFDWSMCKPRGHYDGYPDLEGYFRAMMFLGRLEIRIANQDERHEWHVDHRAFAAAQLLARLFDAKLRDSWQHIDDTLGMFVGPPDSMSLPGLAAGLAALPATPSDAQIGTAFHDRARQKIQTQLVLSSDSAIAFVLFGQRFVLDSKVFSDLTYDALKTTPERLMPTPLDVGHAVFRNPAARELLDSQVERYGKPYEAALAAASSEVDRDPTLGGTSLYHLWLGALRGLSPHADQDTALPAPLTGTAWARRMLSAQLASWAELRHDTLLYAKQSVTVSLGCEYPDGYVDPYPAFYQAMATLAKRGKALGGKRIVAYFDKMEQVMTRLGAIAERERKNQPMTDDDLDFLNHMVSVVGRDGGCTTTYEPEGWYAELYYDQGQAMFHEPVIADVHTQPTDEAGNEVGRVLHVGTGMPHMMVIKIDHDGGDHREVYRGFVSTYRELVTEHFERLTDREWRSRKDPDRSSVPGWLDAITAPAK